MESNESNIVAMFPEGIEGHTKKIWQVWAKTEKKRM